MDYSKSVAGEARTVKDNKPYPYTLDVFKNKTALVAVKFTDEFTETVNAKHFGFAEFVSDQYANNIWVTNSLAKKLIHNSDCSLEKQWWAEVKFVNTAQKKTPFRMVSVWKTIDEAINKSKKPHITLAAKAIREIDKLFYEDAQKQRKFDKYKNKSFTRVDLSEEKQRQLDIRFDQLVQHASDWDEHLINAYTFAEYHVEKWALLHQFSFIDYNSENLYAEQDCSINGVDIDVKSVLGVGRRRGDQYSAASEKCEILVGVATQALSLNGTSIGLELDGIFDPSRYANINTPLKYLTLDRKVNVCYFSSLAGYFVDKQPRYFEGEVNDSVFLYLLHQHYIGSLLQSLPQERRNRLLANLIKPSNWAISAIIIELIDKDRLSLFPHYLADFVISSIVNKAPIDSPNIGFLMSQICPFARRQKVYILDLLKANESLAAVRCHWHPEETVKDMGIDIHFSNEALVPTFKAVCNCNLEWKTTFFTYSWKTYDTLSYGSDDDICDNDNCGCLLQGYEERYIGLGDVYLGKSSCKKYGKEAYKHWEELGKFPHSKNRKLSNHS